MSKGQLLQDTSCGKNKSADVYQYNALSDGIKKLYTNEDELRRYGNKGILDPDTVSYFNLFINGVLQPKVNYELQKGLLLLKTEDVPLKDSIIIIIFVTFKDKEPAVLNLAEAKGFLPSGYISDGPVSDMDIDIEETVASCLGLETTILSGPDSLPAGSSGSWEFVLTTSNTGNIPVTGITVTSRILLDFISSIEQVSSSHGDILIRGDMIYWNLEIINGGEAALAVFKAEGLFHAHGIRSVSRSFAKGRCLYGPVKTGMVCTDSINVRNGLAINTTIVSGPLKINTKKQGIWKIQIDLSNLGNDVIFDILATDILLIEDICHVKIMNVSHGTASLRDNKILWRIDKLEQSERAVLTADITGCFSEEGNRSLDKASGTGYIGTGRLSTNTSKYFQIMVLGNSKQVKKELLLQNLVSSQPLTAFAGSFKRWNLCLKITNLTVRVLKNIIVTDNILFDEFQDIYVCLVSSGHISIAHDTLIWHIEELPPCSTSTVIFEIKGLFHSAGPHFLSRAIATAGAQGQDCCILSNISSGPVMNVSDHRQDSGTNCILIDKVFSQYQQKDCLKDICVDMGGNDVISIEFISGTIVKNTLVITDLGNGSNFKRVRFLLQVPFEITTDDHTIIKGHLPNISKDLIVFIPQLQEEQSFHITADTSTDLLTAPVKVQNGLRFSVGISTIIKAVGSIQLLTCNPGFYPKQASFTKSLKTYSYDTAPYGPVNKLSSLNKPVKIWRNNQCADIFGSLTTEKHIISGPLEVTPDTAGTWKIEVKMTNRGYGPVSNVVMTDRLLPDSLLDFNLISLTQGSICRHNEQIVWNAGTLNSGNMIVLTAEITGLFYHQVPELLHAETYQYNTISDGIKREYRNEDGLPEYSNRGIPDPELISFFSLFINGSLQPETIYAVEPGLLTLKTENTPQKGAPVTLEYVIIKEEGGRLLKAKTCQYNTLANGGKSYTNSDELTKYGNKGILDPEQTSFQNLFINGVLQPETNYIINEGLLTLEARPLPVDGVPISIQFISLSS